MNKAAKSALPPGSPEAIKLGCKCPEADNAAGLGAGTGKDGKPLFWFSAECPLHHHLVPAELAT
jgi:hypothetical protein